MSRLSLWLRIAYLGYLSKPAKDRAVFRAVQKLRPRRIVEVGLGNGQRSMRLIDLAQRLSPQETIHYTGIDLFEGRKGGWALKAAYKELRGTGAKLRLLPGEPFQALSAMANNLLETDLLVLSRPFSGKSFEQAWFYVPRMLTANSVVLVEAIPPKGQPEIGYRRLTLAEVQAKADAEQPRKRLAA